MTKKSKLERREALARLAAGEVASLMNRSIEMTRTADVNAAMARLQKMFGGQDVLPDKNALSVLDQLVKHLRSSELNINFAAKDFFSTSKLHPKYTTKYEKMRAAGAPMGDTRNKAEAYMFHYASGAGVDPATATPGQAAASSRVAAIGDIESDEFVGSIRPKYCSVNFAALKDGMGAQWGRSHLVLAEHLKPNMTFIHSDSFDIAGGGRMFVGGKSVPVTPLLVNGQLASFHEMTRLIVNMSDNMLEALVDSATGQWAPGKTSAEFKQKYVLGSTSYVEGHIHAEIFMARDVKKVRIANDDVDSQPNATKLKKRISKFGTKFNVTVEYFS